MGGGGKGVGVGGWGNGLRGGRSASCKAFLPYAHWAQGSGKHRMIDVGAKTTSSLRPNTQGCLAAFIDKPVDAT